MSAVVVGSYYESIPDADKELFSKDKAVVVDSKVLMLSLSHFDEANYVCGILNAKDIVDVIDGYAISTNRGVDVLKYLAIPKYDAANQIHKEVSELSRDIHSRMREKKTEEIPRLEAKLNQSVRKIFL